MINDKVYINNTCWTKKHQQARNTTDETAMKDFHAWYSGTSIQRTSIQRSPGYNEQYYLLPVIVISFILKKIYTMDLHEGLDRGVQMSVSVKILAICQLLVKF